MKYFYVIYKTVEGEHEYRESGVLQAGSYIEALKKAVEAKRLFDRYGWEEFCEQSEVIEITKGEYMVLKRFMLDIEPYFNECGLVRI